MQVTSGQKYDPCGERETDRERKRERLNIQRKNTKDNEIHKQEDTRRNHMQSILPQARAYIFEKDQGNIVNLVYTSAVLSVLWQDDPKA